MKGVTAALEAKRARAGGGEKAPLIQHAKGRRTASGSLPIVTLMSAFLIVSAADSWSQETGARWTSSDGAFSLSIPRGWQRVDRLAQGTRLLVIASSTGLARPNRGDLELCYVSGEEFEDISPQTQDRINAMMDGLLPVLLAAPPRPIAVHSSSSELIDGVRVLNFDMDLQTDGALTRQMRGVFSLSMGARMIAQYSIVCDAGSTYEAADLEAMRGFIASLSFHPKAAP